MAEIKIGRVRMVFTGEWDAATAYKALDTVTQNGTSYAAVRDVSAGVEPEVTLNDPDPAWMVIAERGLDGDEGPEGPQGPQGEKGDDGQDGDTGPKGDKGDIGPEGPEGPEGPQGPSGEDGVPVTLTAGTGLNGGGFLDIDRTISLSISSTAEAQDGLNNTTAMTPLRTAEAQDARQASVIEVRSLAGESKVPTTERIAQAAELITPSGDSSWAPDWNTFINANWVLTGNRTLSNPSNVKAGTVRIVRVVSSNSTERTISFGSNYVGDLNGGPVTSSSPILYTLFAATPTEIWVSSMEVE